MDLLDHVLRPLPHLPVDPVDVLSQDAEGEKLHSHEHEQDSEEREDALCSPQGAESQPGDGQEDAKKHPKQRHADAAVHKELHGEVRKGRDEVELEVDQLAKGVARLPAVPLFVVDLDFRHTLAEIGGERRDESESWSGKTGQCISGKAAL